MENENEAAIKTIADIVLDDLTEFCSADRIKPWSLSVGPDWLQLALNGMRLHMSVNYDGVLMWFDYHEIFEFSDPNFPDNIKARIIELTDIKE